MRNIMDYDVKGKKILVRVDLNSPVVNGQVQMNERIKMHAKTLKMLSDKKAKVIALAHQGRDGDPDFIMLQQHAELLSSEMKKEVIFVPYVIGANVKKTVEMMNDGDIVLLENVRFLKSENLESGEIVGLSYLADYYVLDALSVAHRAHSSVVGFSKIIPAFYGPVLAQEVSALKKVKESDGTVFVLGGSKIEDSFDMIENYTRAGKKGKYLTGGVIAILLLKAKGYSVGDSEKYLEKEGLLEYLERAKKILEIEGVEIPSDVALNIDGKRVETSIDRIEKGEIFDIGQKTIEKYSAIIKNAKTIVMNGPMGVYEQPLFGTGTKQLLNEIANSKGFSLLGGGHTTSAIETFGFRKEKYGYVSLSGKALIKYLCGEKLPGLDALEENEKNFPVER
ncbi:MAG: phosphoglycerate kinase [Candidatus Bilamarchaeaceae archaeon]